MGGGCDQVAVTGTATLAGTLHLLIDPTLTPTGLYTLLSYGSRSGEFQTIVPPPGASPPTAWYDNPTPGAMGVSW
jgi:hypothetical protein